MFVSIFSQNVAILDPIYIYTMHLSIGVAESHPEYIESIEIYVPCRSVYHMHCLSLLNVVI